MVQVILLAVMKLSIYPLLMSWEHRFSFDILFSTAHANRDLCICVYILLTEFLNLRPFEYMVIL
jgi:hypothetical protein